MKKRYVIPWGIMLWLGAFLAGGVFCSMRTYAQHESNRSTIAAIDPTAAELLRKMSDKLTGAQQFTVTGKRTMDPALAQGRPVNLTITFELSVQRPNRLRARMEGDGTKRTFVYDGARATLYDETINAFASVESPGSIDTMLDGLQERYGFTPPLADFLIQNPYAGLTGDVQSGRDAGRETVGGEDCHHLSFNQENADWELWLATSDQLPRKFVLTQKNMPGRPRLEAEFTRWELAPRLEAGTFAYTPPQDAQKIEMIPIDRVEESSAAGRDEKQGKEE